MCCVTIAHNDYLLPADKGMKLVELMQSAFETRKDWGDRSYSYHIGEQPNVEFCLVKASQVKSKAANTNAAGQRLIGMDD